MRLFDVAEIDAALSYPGLIDILDDAFRSEVIAPKRGQYAIERPGEESAILLTMPAWSGPDARASRPRCSSGPPPRPPRAPMVRRPCR